MQRGTGERSEKRFCIVSFPDDEDLYIVSSRWLTKGKSEYICLWPPYKGDSRIKKAVMEEERPSSSWLTSSAKLIKKCKTYKGAENFLKTVLMVSKRHSNALHNKERESIAPSSDLPSAKRVKIEQDSDASTSESSSSESNELLSPPVISESEVVAEPVEDSSTDCPMLSPVEAKAITCSSTYQFLMENTSSQSYEEPSSAQDGGERSDKSLEDPHFSWTEASMLSKYESQPGNRKYANYTEEKLQECLEAVRTKQMTQREAESFYKISRATIKRKLKNQHINSPGHPKVFTTEEELAFASHLDKIFDFGFPCDEIDFRSIVKAYLASQGRIVNQFKNNLPGRDWVKSFLSRHPQLAVRFAANLKRVRAAVDIKVIMDYIENLSNELEGVPSANIYNYDETNVSDDPGSRQVICRRGCKYPERVINSTKSNISIMFCGNASGTTLPPYIIYKAQNLWNNWTENGPLGARYNGSEHGWIDLAIFEEWFISHLLPVLRRQEGKKVIIGDNLTSHISFNVVKLCKENNISFVCQPPNSTRITQPLDMAYFRPLKMKWRDVLSRWKQSDVGKRLGLLSKDQFPRLLRTVLDELQPNMARNLKAGFKKAGIAPMNKEEIFQQVLNQGKHLNLSMVGKPFLEQLEQKQNELLRPIEKEELQVPPGKSICVSDLQLNEDFSGQDEIPSTSRNLLPETQSKHPSKEKLTLEESLQVENCVFFD